jgi:hypothetical protein
VEPSHGGAAADESARPRAFVGEAAQHLVFVAYVALAESLRKRGYQVFGGH